MIILSGIIGSGKSSLTKILAEELNTKAFFEPVDDNPVLPLYYEGNKIATERRSAGDKNATNPYAYLLQTYFLNRRFKMIKQAMQQDNNVLDRSIYEDALFMKINTDMGNATEVEYQVYKSLLDNMMEELPYAAKKKAPDLMITIKVSHKTMLNRIAKRGRSYEQIKNDATLDDYYRRLLHYYDDWMEHYDISPQLIIDGDKYDFMGNVEHRRQVLDMIKQRLINLGKLPDNAKASHD